MPELISRNQLQSVAINRHPSSMPELAVIYLRLLRGDGIDELPRKEPRVPEQRDHQPEEPIERRADEAEEESSDVISGNQEAIRAPQSSSEYSSTHVTKPRRAVQFLLSTAVTRSRHTTSIHRMHHAYPAPGT